ncbi:Coiled-coil domain-containing protein 77 [Intoshia linei]|uniref:Coiled-coil domain-containing protein 77 n=1 Tax=Intoshia linei TaxID=1819745 RepID=A0A177B049_9BILA|nr:Coiled-coil domain-containing protein 77 [Intoshia linei]
MRQKKMEICALQKALGDMQNHLLQERDLVLRLYSENDRLKINEVQMNRKINMLLNINVEDESEYTYFINDKRKLAIESVVNANPKKCNVPKRFNINRKELLKNPDISNLVDSLNMQIAALQKQIAEKTKLSTEQMSALKNEHNIRAMEMETLNKNNDKQLSKLEKNLNNCQKLLYQSTSDLIESKSCCRRKELEWMTEKQSFLNKIEYLKALNESKACKTVKFQDKDNNVEGILQKNLQLKEESSVIQKQNKELESLLQMFRHQTMELEDDKAQILEKGEEGESIYRNKIKKLSEQLSQWKKKYNNLVERKSFEAEGFRTDIRQLKDKIKNIEKSIQRVLISYTINQENEIHDLDELNVLKAIHQNSHKTQEAIQSLKKLKFRLYDIENKILT